MSTLEVLYDSRNDNLMGSILEEEAEGPRISSVIVDFDLCLSVHAAERHRLVDFEMDNVFENLPKHRSLLAHILGERAVEAIEKLIDPSVQPPRRSLLHLEVQGAKVPDSVLT